jgi:hypothetical protein
MFSGAGWILVFWFTLGAEQPTQVAGYKSLLDCKAAAAAAVENYGDVRVITRQAYVNDSQRMSYTCVPAGR